MGSHFRLRRPWRQIGVAMAACLLTVAGCRRSINPPATESATPPAPSTRPVTLLTDGATTTGQPAASSQPATPARAEQTYENKSAGFRMRYAGDWIEKKSPEDLLMIVPINGPDDRTITMDVPPIPGHLPGLMTMPLIENGYIDDLRKHHKGLKVEETKDQTIAHSKTRMVRSTWKENGKNYTDFALLIVHADRVYILSLDSDAEGYAATKAEMDKIAGTLEWVK